MRCTLSPPSSPSLFSVVSISVSSLSLVSASRPVGDALLHTHAYTCTHTRSTSSQRLAAPVLRRRRSSAAAAADRPLETARGAQPLPRARPSQRHSRTTQRACRRSDAGRGKGRATERQRESARERRTRVSQSLRLGNRERGGEVCLPNKRTESADAAHKSAANEKMRRRREGKELRGKGDEWGTEPNAGILQGPAYTYRHTQAHIKRYKGTHTHTHTPSRAVVSYTSEIKGAEEMKIRNTHTQTKTNRTGGFTPFAPSLSVCVCVCMRQRQRTREMAVFLCAVCVALCTVLCGLHALQPASTCPHHTSSLSSLPLPPFSFPSPSSLPHPSLPPAWRQ